MMLSLASALAMPRGPLQSSEMTARIPGVGAENWIGVADFLKEKFTVGSPVDLSCGAPGQQG